MRVIFDNNVLISAALLKNSIPYQAFKKAVENYVILRSHSLLDELRNTIYKEKFNKYFIQGNSRDTFVLAFMAASINIEVNEKVTLCRDPKDNMYLELALSGEANFLVTGDADLLILNPLKDIAIISPKDFLDQY